MPFHRSASVSSVPARLVKDPTAVQNLVEAQETPASPLFTWAMVGLGCTAQPEAAAAAAIVSHSANVTQPATARATIRAPVAAPPEPSITSGDPNQQRATVIAALSCARARSRSNGTVGGICHHLSQQV